MEHKNILTDFENEKNIRLCFSYSYFIMNCKWKLYIKKNFFLDSYMKKSILMKKKTLYYFN